MRSDPRRHKSAAILAIVLVGCSAAHSGANAPVSGAAEPAGNIVFFDDFSGPSLDRSKWTPRVSGPIYNDEQQAYIDDTATVSIVSGAAAHGATNGALKIRARFRPGYVTPEGKRFDFVSGRLDTQAKMEFMHGSAAARMRLPSGHGFWPAFWILGTGDWPATGEIDVMENVGEPSWVSAAVHGPGYAGEEALVRHDAFPAGQDASGWHVYAVDWSADAMAFRVDDREIYRVTRAMVAPHGAWSFDNKKYLIVNLAVGGGYPRKENHWAGSRVGLPDSTMNSIKADTSAVLVDWIRVTQK
jgi:beta-glucanase (GH16 family)